MGVNREVHAPFCERPAGEIPPAYSPRASTSTNMARRYGRCRIGERLRISVPHGQWETTTFIGALKVHGSSPLCHRQAPINRLSFETYVEKEDGGRRSQCCQSCRSDRSYAEAAAISDAAMKRAAEVIRPGLCEAMQSLRLLGRWLKAQTASQEQTLPKSPSAPRPERVPPHSVERRRVSPRLPN